MVVVSSLRKAQTAVRFLPAVTCVCWTLLINFPNDGSRCMLAPYLVVLLVWECDTVAGGETNYRLKRYPPAGQGMLQWGNYSERPRMLE